jgi:hypothetical protein
VLTVSPIRYKKYGFHESQLSKATLLLSIERLMSLDAQRSTLNYFPAYEIVLDELRDYRFYNEDMLHPSQQAVEYLWERIGESLLTERTLQYLEEYRPIKQALNHRPFNAESEEYKAFRQQTIEKLQHLNNKYKIQQNK